jgi:hypothetical protein
MQHIPMRISTNYMLHQPNQIIMTLDDSDLFIQARIMRSQRNSRELYIGGEWSQFVNGINVNVGSRIRLTLSEPPEILTIHIIDQPLEL